MPKETIVRKKYPREIKYICIEQKPNILYLQAIQQRLLK